MISWMMESNRAARAARFLMEFFDVVSQTTTWSFQIYGFNNNEAVNLSLVTIRANQRKGHQSDIMTIH